MLAKFLAGWLIALTVSPCTAPFCTIEVADLFGTHSWAPRGVARPSASPHIAHLEVAGRILLAVTALPDDTRASQRLGADVGAGLASVDVVAAGEASDGLGNLSSDRVRPIKRSTLFRRPPPTLALGTSHGHVVSVPELSAIPPLHITINAAHESQVLRV